MSSGCDEGPGTASTTPEDVATSLAKEVPGPRRAGGTLGWAEDPTSRPTEDAASLGAGTGAKEASC